MANPYQDFIPADQDAGALGNGFADFVPAKTPVKEETTPKGETPQRDEKGQFTK